MTASGTIICMRNVPGKPLHRALTAPLPYRKPDGTMGLIPGGFEWDGSSSELICNSPSKTKRFLLRLAAAPLNFFMRSVWPRHRHPIASCKHDYGCLLAKTPEERLFHDREFRKNVRKTSWKITAQAGYAGVRAGAWLGVGVYNY